MSDKKIPEFTGEIQKTTYDILNYIARVQQDPFCAGYLKNWDVRGMAPASVSFAVAKSQIDLFLNSQVKIVPLREVLDAALVKGTAVLSMGGATLIDSEKVETKAVLSAGYFMPVGREADRLPSWIADASAFQLTDATEKTQLGMKGQTVVAGCEAKLHMAEQSFDADVPAGFTNNPVKNATALFNLFKNKASGQFNHNLELMHAQMATKWNLRSLRPVASGVVPPVLDDYIVVENGKKFLPTPSLALQPGKVCTEEVGFYKYLSHHRLIRGADKASALTSGYYFGAMSRSLDQTLWLATDILEFSRHMKRDSIVFSHGEVSQTIYAMLRANGMKVYVIRSTPVVSPFFTVVDPAKWTANPDLANAIFYSTKATGESAPTVTKKGLVGMDKSQFQSFFDSFVTDLTIGLIRLTHVYLRDYMESKLTYMLPSVHVHAGHAMMASVPIFEKASYTMAGLFARASMANKYKTAFPVRRVTYSVQDPYRPLVLLTGIKIVSGAQTAGNKHDINYEDFAAQCTFFEDLEPEPIDFVSTVISVKPAVVIKPIPHPLVVVAGDDIPDDDDENDDFEEKEEKIENEPDEDDEQDDFAMNDYEAF